MEKTENKATTTRIFIAPTIVDVKNFHQFKETIDSLGFINAYVGDADRDVQYENCVYLLFKPTSLDKFRVFLDNEYERTKIVDDYDYANGYIVVVYQLNPDFKLDFDLIKQSKYSKTSQAFQKLFPKVTKIIKNELYRDEISMQYRVFNRTQDLITFWEEKFGIILDSDQEVWSGFILENEILNVNKFKEVLS